MSTALKRRQSDHGFSLVEVLAVIVIIGLLASIAIPLYLDQKKKGHDADAKSDVNTIGSAMVGYLASHDDFPTLTVTGTSVTVNGGVIGTLSSGVVLGPLVGTTSKDWCIDATQPDGDRAKVKGYKFTSTKGKVEEGQCT